MGQIFLHNKKNNITFYSIIENLIFGILFICFLSHPHQIEGSINIKKNWENTILKHKQPHL